MYDECKQSYIFDDTSLKKTEMFILVSVTVYHTHDTAL